MSYTKNINYCLNVFGPYFAVLAILIIESVSLPVILCVLALLYWAQRTTFHMSYDFAQNEFEQWLEENINTEDSK